MRGGWRSQLASVFMVQGASVVQIVHVVQVAGCGFAIIKGGVSAVRIGGNEAAITVARNRLLHHAHINWTGQFSYNRREDCSSSSTIAAFNPQKRHAIDYFALCLSVEPTTVRQNSLKDCDLWLAIVTRFNVNIRQPVASRACIFCKGFGGNGCGRRSSG